MRDTTTLIWDHLYRCRIPQLDSTSIDYMRAMGSYITGDPGIDREMSNQWITTMINIDTMVEYYRQGVAIKVCNYSDTKHIYEAISEHLLAWRTRLTHGINIGDAPIEDLILMDEFANVVYDHAKYQFTRDMVDSMFAKELEGITKYNALNFFASKPTPQHATDEQGGVRINSLVPDVPDRDSHSEFLKQRVLGLSTWRTK